MREFIEDNPETTKLFANEGSQLVHFYTDHQQLREEELKALQDSNNNERRLQLLEEALEDRRELAAQQRQLVRELQQDRIQIKLKEIQASWDEDNWAGILSRDETEELLSQTQNGLLLLLAPPEISPDCPSSIRNNLQYDLVQLDSFLAQYYPQTDPHCPVKFYEDYFKRPIGTTTIDQLYNLLSPVPTAVLSIIISDYLCIFKGGFWGYQQDSVASFTMTWNWESAFYKLMQAGETEEKALRLIRLMIVRAQKVLACCLADYHYASIDPYYSPRLPQFMEELIQEGIPHDWLAPIVTRLEDYHQQVQQVYEERLEELVRLAEPPTLVVDSFDDQGEFKTISEAIRFAPPGSKILVHPGLYQEGVVMDKPLEILGVGDPKSIIVEAHGRNVLLFQTTQGRLANLTLRQTGGGQWYGVDVVKGHLDLDGCDISSQSLACVAIHSDAYAWIQGSRIHDGQQGGVWFYDGGQGLLENNDIFANSYPGVLISTQSNPNLRNNNIHDNGEYGVYVH